MADRLTKTYGARDAVHELSFTVERGDVYGLLGPNGAGKTTTVRSCWGSHGRPAGPCVLGARPGTTASLRGVGSLVEEPALYPYLSGRDNLRVLARYTSAPRTRIDEVLDLVGLLPRTGDTVRTYSLGMRQRLRVAAALLKDPDLLVLDELTSGLDPQGMAQMRRVIRELASGDRAELNSALVAAVVAVSHLSVQRRALEDVVLDMTAASALGRSPGATSDGPGASAGASSAATSAAS